MAERRKHQRFRVKDKAFAMIKGSPVEPVRITDVSLGGLGVSDFESRPFVAGSSKLEILLADCSFFLENLSFNLIPCLKPVYPNLDQIPPARYHGVHFTNLMPDQINQLQYFIRTFSTGGMTSKFLNATYEMWHRMRANPILVPIRYRT